MKKIVSIKDIIVDEMKWIEDIRQNGRRVKGIPTGFRKIDDLLSGLQRSNLIVCAARPSMHKTEFALTIARNAALAQVPVAIISLLTGREHIARRFLCMEAKIKIEQIDQGLLSESDWLRLAQAARKLSDLPIFTCGMAGRAVASIRKQIEISKYQHGAELVMIDCLQLIQSDGLCMNREQEIDDICRALKEIALDFDLPLIVLSQVSRRPEFRSNHRPRMSDLAEGDVASYADVVFFIYRDYVYHRFEDNPEKDIAEITIPKNKNGAIGFVKLFFDESTRTFEDLTGNRCPDPSLRLATIEPENAVVDQITTG